MTTQEILAATTERLEFRRSMMLDRIDLGATLTEDQEFEFAAIEDELLSRQRLVFVLEH